MDYPFYDEKADVFWLSEKSKLVDLHPASACAGRHCAIHNPSDHSMRGFRLSWRQCFPIMDIKPSHFERVCPHGVGHPDPDDMEYWHSIGESSMGVHGCDGCCAPDEAIAQLAPHAKANLSASRKLA